MKKILRHKIQAIDSHSDNLKGVEEEPVNYGVCVCVWEE